MSDVSDVRDEELVVVKRRGTKGRAEHPGMAVTGRGRGAGRGVCFNTKIAPLSHFTARLMAWLEDTDSGPGRNPAPRPPRPLEGVPGPDIVLAQGEIFPL